MRNQNECIESSGKLLSTGCRSLFGVVADVTQISLTCDDGHKTVVIHCNLIAYLVLHAGTGRGSKGSSASNHIVHYSRLFVLKPFMNTTAGRDSVSNASEPTLQLSSIVLQPTVALDQVTSAAFQTELELALDRVTEAVIIDFLWVETIDAAGITALAAGLERAHRLGKTLSFQAISSRVRFAVYDEWNRRRNPNVTSWSDRFEQDLENFLDEMAS